MSLKERADSYSYFTQNADSAYVPHVRPTEHAQNSKFERVCGRAEIHTHLLDRVEKRSEHKVAGSRIRHSFGREEEQVHGRSYLPAMANFSASFEQSWSELEDSMLSSPFGLLDLPSEVLVLILRYLPLSDLANARLVSKIHLLLLLVLYNISNI